MGSIPGLGPTPPPPRVKSTQGSAAPDAVSEPVSRPNSFNTQSSSTTSTPSPTGPNATAAPQITQVDPDLALFKKELKTAADLRDSAFAYSGQANFNGVNIAEMEVQYAKALSAFGELQQAVVSKYGSTAAMMSDPETKGLLLDICFGTAKTYLYLANAYHRVTSELPGADPVAVSKATDLELIAGKKALEFASVLYGQSTGHTDDRVNFHEENMVLWKRCKDASMGEM